MCQTRRRNRRRRPSKGRKGGRPRKLKDAVTAAFTVDAPTIKAIVRWQRRLKCSRSAALRAIVAAAPVEPEVAG